MSSIKTNVPPQCPCALHVGNCDKGGKLLAQLLTLTASEEEDFDSISQELLRITCSYFEVDRGYIFQYDNEDVNRAIPLFEWLNPNSTEFIAKVPEISPASFNGYRNVLLDNQVAILSRDIPINDVRISSAEQEEFKSSGVLSRLVCGYWLNNQLAGFIGFDCIGKAQDFFECQISTVNSIVKIFQLAFRQTHQYVLLQESLSLQRQIMDNIAVPILLVDLDYRVRAANPTKKINVDMPFAKLIGTYCYETVCKCGAPPDFCSVQETLRTLKPARKEFSFWDKRLISTAQPIFDRSGKMKYVLSVDLDITEVTRQKEELKVAMEQAQSANHAKSYFLATVSHELRTPLNAVIGFSELLQKSGIDEATQREYLQSINFAGTALLNLINDVLDLSNLEANQTLISPALTNVGEMINQVLSIFKLKTLQKNIELTQETSELRYPLYIDSLRFRQILLNLIGNAIKFTNQGGVTVRGTFTPETDTHGYLVIQVIDTGMGISPENQEKIFEPFVHDSVIRGSRMYEGSGLGLTISRRLLDKMNGRVSLESEVGKGTTFTVELQVQYEQKELALETNCAKQIVEEPSAIPSTHKLRMLLVDDVPINLKVLAAILKQINIDSVSVDSAAQALEVLRSDSEFDFILTDMWMPECDGTQLAKLIRNELKITNIPIWAVTADTQVADDKRINFDGILYKPITQTLLQDMLSKR